MVRRKASVALSVYKDGDSVAAQSAHRDNGDAPQQHPHPVKRRKRDPKVPPIGTPTNSVKRRAALKEKPPNPSSSDASFLHPAESLTQKHGQEKRKSVLNDGLSKVPESGSAADEGTSLLRESFAIGGPVYRALKKQLTAKEFDQLLGLVGGDIAQEVADFVNKKSCWSPGLLDSFRGSKLESLDLSSPSSPSGTFIPHISPTHTLKILFQQNQFAALSVVSLRNTPLSNDDMAFLLLLPSLADLDISNTGLGTHSLHHLVCHRQTLGTLNISLNPAMDDDSRVALSALVNLAALYLRGTSITMPGLRRLTTAGLPPSCRLISIPAPCIECLNDRHSKYVVEIPPSYVQDPRQVATMTVPNLKKNLELHAKANRDIQVTGTKVEMIARLTAIVQNRIADVRIMKALGRVPALG